MRDENTVQYILSKYIPLVRIPKKFNPNAKYVCFVEFGTSKHPLPDKLGEES